MKRLLLLRHGSTDWSSERKLCGSSDLPLNDRGLREAHEAASRVALFAIDAAWSSDLDRAVTTARISSPLPASPDPRLREMNFGDLEGERFDDLEVRTREALLAFDGFAAPGGEAVSALSARVDTFLDELAHGTHLIVTHGGVIRSLLRRYGEGDRLVLPCELVPVVLEPRT
ncbi:MAG: histidine phosphatase family protein [Actinomycetota bacterium]